VNFIFAFDGPDASGKTLISALVSEELKLLYKPRGFTVISHKMPGATSAGMEIRKVLKNPEIAISPLAERFLFAADTADFFHCLSVGERQPYKINIVDRWSPVTDYMYGLPRGVDEKTLADIRAVYMGQLGIKPDVLFLVDVTVDDMLARMHAARRPACRIEQLGDNHHIKIWGQYKEAANLARSAAHKHCASLAHRVHRLDNTDPSKRSIREVADEALAEIKKVIENRIENTRDE